MTELTAGEKKRIRSIDLVRGIVMIIMALDHVRDFFHNDAMVHDPLNLATTSPILFFTRFITHFCAPTFVFLSGVSAYLSGRRKSKADLGNFLIKRGLWLILIEVAVITLGFSFNPLYNFILLQVIWAIGVSMVLLGLMVRLPFSLILVLGIIIVFGHNSLDYLEAAGLGKNSHFYHFLHVPQLIQYAPSRVVFEAYPFLPWTGVMLLGYCFGRLFEPRFAETRKRTLFLIGLGLIVLFVALRFTNNYGDPTHWARQKSPMFTFLSFINVTKYPPSLLYLCVTLGPSIILLALLENVRNPFTNFVNVYGRVPFFYYVLHFYLIHILCVIAFFATGYTSKDIISPNVPFLFRPATFGFSLPVVYLVWLFVFLALYFPCRWFDRYKTTHHQWWLSYL